MKEKFIEIKNEHGVHARPAARIVKLVKDYESELTIIDDDFIANGSDVMDVMSLGAAKGKKLLFRAIGRDEEELLDALYQLIEVDTFFE